MENKKNIFGIALVLIFTFAILLGFSVGIFENRVRESSQQKSSNPRTVNNQDQAMTKSALVNEKISS